MTDILQCITHQHEREHKDYQTHYFIFSNVKGNADFRDGVFLK